MQRQLSPLTGLRGVAAYAVLIAHAIDTSFYYSGHQPFHEITLRLAYLGMSLFFVLSGFVIQFNYGVLFAKEPLRRALYRFFVARFARLYPLYALTLIPALAYFPSPFFTSEWGAALAYLTLTQSWFNVQMAAFPPDWSVSTEWFFYFAFVPLTLIYVRRPVAALVVAGIAGVALFLVFFMFFQGIGLALVERCCVHDPKVSASAWGWITYFSPLTRLPEFIMGMLAAKAYALLQTRPLRPTTIRIVIWLCSAWCAATVVLAVTRVPYFGLLASNFMFAPALAPLMLCCCLYDGGLSRALSSRPLMFAGEISYSVYIWSWSAMTLLDHDFISAEPSLLAYFNSGVKVVACVGYATIFAYGSYLLIEAPARSFLRSTLTARAAVPSAAVRRTVASATPIPREVFARIMHSWGLMRSYATPGSDHAVHSLRRLRGFVDNADGEWREGPARNRVEALDVAP